MSRPIDCFYRLLTIIENLFSIAYLQLFSNEVQFIHTFDLITDTSRNCFKSFHSFTYASFKSTYTCSSFNSLVTIFCANYWVCLYCPWQSKCIQYNFACKHLIILCSIHIPFLLQWAGAVSKACTAKTLCVLPPGNYCTYYCCNSF